MDVRLTRIDDRLIHGQVATVWSRTTGIDRILVVSDEVAEDDLRKFLLKQAAPPGIKSNVITVSKLIEIFDNQMFQYAKVMLLFTNPLELKRVVEAGISIASVNIGGMRYTNGKRMLTNFVSVDQEDISAFQYLASRGIELEIRKVPSDRKLFVMDLLRKEKFL